MFYFLQNVFYFTNLSFSVQMIHFFINHALNLNTHAGWIKVKELATVIMKQ